MQTRMLNRFTTFAILASTAAAALAQFPIGLDAMNLDDIAKLRQGVRTYQASSYQRDGGNYDRGNFLSVDGSEYVMLDVEGPGCIYRIWMTGIGLSERIRIYFDGETTPSVDMTHADFFAGTNAPFLAPLCVNDDVSSGGFICYVPMPFRTGCRITTETSAAYYNVSYQKFADATGVTTFTGTEDSSAIRADWDDVTTDPKADPGAASTGGTVTITPGSTHTLANLTGAGSIQGLELTIPDLDAELETPIYDEGRAHRGVSSFTMAIDPNNTGVDLVRRLDYSIGNQKANVSVDGTNVGEWFTSGAAAGYWLDSTFAIPSSETAGKSSIDVDVSFVSSDNDWNEFTYWAYSLVGGDRVETDVLDVRNAASEAAHSYSITGQTWEGDGTRPYFDPNTVFVTDDGRATAYWIQFDATIDPNNTGVHLTRRLDYTIANQKGNVYVDGALVGEWFTEGGSPNYFVNSTFEIPGSFTSGKSSITIKVEFVSSAIDWNEFYYWVKSVVGGTPVLTDELDVGDATDEAAHSYHIENPVWYGVRTFEYYTESGSNPQLDIIENVRLVATWDGAATPQIDVPIGGFFGSNIGPSAVHAFPVGIVGSDLYCWLPMPYADGALVQLVNDSNQPLTDMDYTVRYTTMPSSAVTGLGRLNAQFNEERPCTWGRDFTILDVTGAGHFVGVVQTSAGDGLGYLEGDERIYIDGSQTPVIYGTGTEDFYNGGWYFNRGRFSLPTHGNPTMDGSPIATDMYRYFVSDLIPFTTSLKVGIEHGPMNDTTGTDIWSVALYYHQDEPLAILTDEIDVGDTASEAAHGYVGTGQSWSGTLADHYEGDDNDILITDDGRHYDDGANYGAVFTVSIDPNNAGVLLRRRIDFNEPYQQATVHVDTEPVGTWLEPGRNVADRFRDSEIMLPAALTAGKSSITVQVMNTGVRDWTEYYYWVYSLKPVPSGAPLCPGDANCDGFINFRDIDYFVAAQNDNVAAWEALFGGAPSCDFLNNDTNGDGFVNFRDIDPFVALQNTTCP